MVSRLREIAGRLGVQSVISVALIGSAIVVLTTQSSVGQFQYHSPPKNCHPVMDGQDKESLPSLLVTAKGQRVQNETIWWEECRPKIRTEWIKVLGKIEPTAADAKWFGDVTKCRRLTQTQEDGYRRIELEIPLENDFFQKHLLLIPDHPLGEKMPAVIAWTSTSPDYTAPETWWGSWLAKRGVIVLTSWSFIRHYRDDTSYGNGASEKVYERFGRWLPMGKMVHDVSRQVEFLKSRNDVDGDRIAFMGFSLSAKTALYAAALCPEISVTVAVDPHLPIYGASNYDKPWYLDVRRRFSDIETPDYPVPELRGTVWSLLDADPTTPGFERNHHELLALVAPRAIQVIGCSTNQWTAVHSNDRQSKAYILRAKEVFDLLDCSSQLEYVELDCGHQVDHPDVQAAWRSFLSRHLLSQ